MLVLLVLYVSSYALWSRVALSWAKQYNTEGYYFICRVPQGASARIEVCVQLLYAPCIFIECKLLRGQCPSSIPLDLS